jgi:hypothetical protein
MISAAFQTETSATAKMGKPESPPSGRRRSPAPERRVWISISHNSSFSNKTLDLREHLVKEGGQFDGGQLR